MFSLLAIAVVLVVAGYGVYLANMAGRLPWQEEPTRIPVTPFANLGGPSDDDADEELVDGTPVTDARWLIGAVTYLAPDLKHSHGLRLNGVDIEPPPWLLAGLKRSGGTRLSITKSFQD